MFFFNFLNFFYFKKRLLKIPPKKSRRETLLAPRKRINLIGYGGGSLLT